ncbi:glycosyltransferase family 4 protein [Pseudoruegeria aquimaris]|uniref:glycosyltransferase family 4 protein n=1 Tax=Pseudoruegeria aquimaris TaxID=393663 RepID=UPI0015937797|nr:glycosyltransferase family 1 protein [Pseudoruegeria aquimaris]
MDRVEAAYLSEVIERPEPAFGLLRSRYGFLLLDRSGLSALKRWLAAPETLVRRDLLSRLPPRRTADAQAIETAARAVCIARCLPRQLRGRLRTAFPEGFDYFNTGHANLSPEVLSAMQGGESHVLVHDVIPLDHPQFQRPGTVESFTRKMRAVSQGASRCIYSSRAARADAERHFAAWGRVPPAVVAPLGVDIEATAPGGERRRDLPADPYFLIVGTIEPRKNHVLLLDIWERLLAETGSAPTLCIVGRRGWNNAAVFARLDEAARWRGCVREMGAVPDAELAALMAGARAMLFPSLAEGYGLPPIEAAALGVPVVCNTLPVYRETLGDIPIYADASDQYQWVHTVRKLAEASVPERKNSADGFRPPQWRDHFATVFGN